MKTSTTLLTLFFCISLLSCKKDGDAFKPETVDSDCEVSTESTTALYQSAVTLYSEKAEDSSHPDYSSLKYSDSGIQLILEKLSAVYNAKSSSSQFEEIVDDYGFGASPDYLNSDFMVSFSDAAVFENCRDNPGSTGYTFLDALVNDHGYGIESEYSSISALLYTTDSLMNLRYLDEQLESELPSGSSVDPNHIYGQSRRIEYSISGDEHIFVFDYGWGDCPSGCISHHYWDIRVDKDCNVELVKDWGDPLP